MMLSFYINHFNSTHECVRNKRRLTKADSAPDTELMTATLVAIKIDQSLQFPKNCFFTKIEKMTKL